MPVAADGDSLEELITGAWAEVLDTPHIDPDKGIFDLGATSMTALQAHKIICAGLGREFPLSTLFRCPTVRQLAAHLRDGAPPPSYGRRRRPAGSATARTRSR